MRFSFYSVLDAIWATMEKAFGFIADAIMLILTKFMSEIRARQSLFSIFLIVSILNIANNYRHNTNLYAAVISILIAFWITKLGFTAVGEKIAEDSVSSALTLSKHMASLTVILVGFALSVRFLEATVGSLEVIDLQRSYFGLTELILHFLAVSACNKDGSKTKAFLSKFASSQSFQPEGV